MLSLTISVSRAVNVSVVTVGGFILDVSRVDGDTTSLLFRSLVDSRVVGETGVALLSLSLGNGSRQRRLAVIDVT